MVDLLLYAIRLHIRKRWRTWANRRTPAHDRRQFDRRSIFILPTTAGMVFGLLLVVMPLFAAHRWWMTALPIACMACVAAWLWARPEPPAPPPQS